MTPERAKGYCNLRHQDATGAAPGHAASEQTGKKAAPAPTPRTPIESKRAEKMIDTGVMVALSLPEGLPERLAVKDGSPPEALHVTMAFLGDADDLTDEAADTLVAAVKALAAYVPPMAGTIGGLGQFPDNGDGVPTWVPVDVPMLTPVRERLITILGEAGIKAILNHGYTPHITLGYDVKGTSPVPSTDVVFEELAVHIGSRVERIPLGAAVTGYDPALDKPVEGKALEVKVDAQLAGTLEEQIDRLRAAARDAFGDANTTDEVSPSSRYVYVSATWPDRVLVAVHDRDDVEHFEVPYTVTDGAVSLGEPEKVTVTATLSPEPGADHDGDADDSLGRYAEALMDEVATTFALHAKPVEGKAGRVLSGANTSRLQAAVQNLLTVLEAAGVVIIKPAPGDVEAEKEQLEARQGSFAPTPDTTSVAATRAVGVKALDIGQATPDGQVRISRAEHEAMLARLGL